MRATSFNQRKGMALTIVEARAVTGGVDTHADMHVAAALDPIGGLLGVQEFRSARPDTSACSAGSLRYLCCACSEGVFVSVGCCRGRPWWRTCGILWGTPKVFGRLT